MLLIPNSTWRTLLAVSINYKADFLPNSISLEPSPIDFTAYSLYFYLLFGIQSVHIGGRSCLKYNLYILEKEEKKVKKFVRQKKTMINIIENL